MTEVVFKRCSCCGHTWDDRDQFLSDPGLTVTGYMADFRCLENGLFLFTHDIEGCGSTLSIFAAVFVDLYSGPRHQERKALTPECPRYCIDVSQTARCDAVCECAFVREVLHVAKTRLELCGVAPQVRGSAEPTGNQYLDADRL
jgi:hypothetical protein